MKLNWRGLGMAIACVWLPMWVLLYVFLPVVDIELANPFGVGYWLWVAFSLYVGWNADDWFPPREAGL